MAKTKQKPAIIVINSQVVRGSVGGRASGFVLQRLGFPVWTVPTVIYAWHPGHGPSAHFAPDAATFAALLDSVQRAPWIGEVGGVLSGYVGDADQVEPIAKLVEAIKAANPNVRYLCDPIVGDVEGLWDHAELVRMAGALGPRETVVTSALAPPGRIGNLLVTGRETVLVANAVVGDVPSGTGDLLSALYFGHRLDGIAPPLALEYAAQATRGLIDIARAHDEDEMPLSAGQDLFPAPSPSAEAMAGNRTDD
jgi:pyridoxine kinase